MADWTIQQSRYEVAAVRDTQGVSIEYYPVFVSKTVDITVSDTFESLPRAVAIAFLRAALAMLERDED